MGPYVAIIADSFRAASASRVLWIALLCVGLFLIALAPVGYRENVVARISPLEIVNVDRLSQRLMIDLQHPSDKPSSRIAAALPEAFQQRILQPSDDDESRLREEDYAEAFNALLETDESWYDAEAWKSTTRLKELRELDEQATASLSETLQRRRARLRLEAGLRGSIQPRPEKTLSLTYASFATPAEWPLSRFVFKQYLTTMILPMVLNGMLGFVGIVMGILVTAPILPEMLQPGSLHLLLSKPISRPLLYLSKFFGGCAFMLMCVGPLLIGVWLILGLRFELWLPGLFYCIPVYMLLFMVYYSVSCLAALRWKSSIVAALVAIGFWAGCGIIGFASGMLDDLVSDPARIRQISVSGPADDPVVFSSTRGGRLQHWDDSQEQWQEISLQDYRGDVVLGPVPLGDGQFATTRKRLAPMGLRGDSVLAIIDSADQFKTHRGIKLPRGTTRLLSTSDHGLLACGTAGVYFASGPSLRGAEAAKVPDGGLLSGLVNLLDSSINGFESVLPDDFFMQSPSQVQVLPNDDLVVYSAGSLLRLQRQAQSDQWEHVVDTVVEGEAAREAQLGVCRNMVAIVRDEEPLRLFDLATLESRDEVEVPEGKSVAAISGNPAGSAFAVRFTDGTAAMLDVTQDPSFGDLPAELSGASLETLEFADDGSLMAVYAHDSLVILSPSDQQPELRLRPGLSYWRMTNEYVVQPLRNVIPQTGELRSETTRAALSGGSSQEMGQGVFAELTRKRLDVRRPVLTCLGFTAVMLLLGSVMITRQDY
ncbi:ABC transporter permease [Roseimaritima ulvae]|uniref:ABC-2 family transporter protein n=1 Tax=Roseimaritima ulvae TaxID=980254 RepID=A0A5B9QZS3_9BACT|nr:ABC transporter permease [Roseimaritima ulvae]QEG42656.1 ABC-2 family transporter protein [Roseimaritima ulvae]